jgi:hypothetical protein
MESRSRVLCALAALATGAAFGAPAPAAMAGPDPVNQPLVDGCQRNPVGLLSYTSPEWAFVGGKQAGDTLRTIEGSSALVHTADEDLPQSHSSYDLDWDVVPDPQYLGLLAGDPGANNGQGNGNFAHDADQGKLHVEWESGSVPSFAWPTEGDRVKLWGHWIWDCGHWGQGVVTDQQNPQGSLQGTGDYFLPGQIEGTTPPGLRGEQTELHPMQAVVVTRAASNQAIAPERETDVFASSDGNHALAEERCARSLSPLPRLPSYGPDFSACVNTPSNQVQDVHGRAYDFFAPAPPRPGPGARLRYRVDHPVVGSGAAETITPVANGLRVHVAWDGVPAGDTTLHAFGARYFVGWEGQDSGPAPLRITMRRLTVNHSLDPNRNRFSQTGPPPGEYNLYLNVNGLWNFIGGHGAVGAVPGEWAPGLGAVNDGQGFDLNHDLVVYVPMGAPVRLDVSGRECDLPRIDPCVVNAEVSDGNDHPGETVVTFPSSVAALGEHTMRSPVDANYELTYSISLAAPGTPPSLPGSTGVASSSVGGTLGGGGRVVNPPAGCADVRAPRSLVARTVKASRQRITLRGTASDLGCGGRPARVRRVELALGRVVGRRCRFLRGDGRFGRLVSCSRPQFTRRARGTSRWTFSRGGRYARGRYLAIVRAVDRAGNVELAASVRNRRRFNVR